VILDTACAPSPSQPKSVGVALSGAIKLPAARDSGPAVLADLTWAAYRKPDAGPMAGTMTGSSFRLIGDFWPAAPTTCACPGDLNCDGVVDFDDINPFIAILSGGG
jgi:hypothetical protein